MQCDRRGGGFTHHTAADVIFDGGSTHWYAGDGRRRRQPIGFIVTTGVRAGSHVTGGEWHGGKHPHTRPRLTWKLLVQILNYFLRYTSN